MQVFDIFLWVQNSVALPKRALQCKENPNKKILCNASQCSVIKVIFLTFSKDIGPPPWGGLVLCWQRPHFGDSIGSYLTPKSHTAYLWRSCSEFYCWSHHTFCNLSKVRNGASKNEHSWENQWYRMGLWCDEESFVTKDFDSCISSSLI